MANPTNKRATREMNRLLTAGSSRFMDEIIKNSKADDSTDGRNLRASRRGHVYIMPPPKGTSPSPTVPKKGRGTEKKKTAPGRQKSFPPSPAKEAKLLTPLRERIIRTFLTETRQNPGKYGPVGSTLWLANLTKRFGVSIMGDCVTSLDVRKWLKRPPFDKMVEDLKNLERSPFRPTKRNGEPSEIAGKFRSIADVVVNELNETTGAVNTNKTKTATPPTSATEIDSDSDRDSISEGAPSPAPADNQVYIQNDRGEWTKAGTLDAEQLVEDDDDDDMQMTFYRYDEDDEILQNSTSSPSAGSAGENQPGTSQKTGMAQGQGQSSNVVTNAEPLEQKMTPPPEVANLPTEAAANNDNRAAPPGDDDGTGIGGVEPERRGPSIGGMSERLQTLQGHVNAALRSYNSLNQLEHDNVFVPCLGHHIAGVVTLVEALVAQHEDPR